MSNKAVLPTEGAKVIPINDGSKTYSLTDLFAPYGKDSNKIFVRFLDELYEAYRSTEDNERLLFSEAIEAHFNYQLLRGFLKGLQPK